jgi:hypothetical protein
LHCKDLNMGLSVSWNLRCYFKTFEIKKPS